MTEMRICASVFTAKKFSGRVRASCKGGIGMRRIALAIIMGVGVGFIGFGGASAAPANGQAIAQTADQANSVVKVWGGCGRGWHRNRWGRCVP
jgi:hypothetical protein